ncbi:MAG: adenosylmethionine decarboxylase [Chlamydiia bacterium]|nr:adenosylmethionine decarboxylase [Chlamydiia bacterium]
MIRNFALGFSLALGVLFADSIPYKFAGKHFLASYLDCDSQALQSVEGTLHAMDEAVKASGATVLDKISYIFPSDGLTIVYLLSESHASLHTYPEHNACFVDLFTCGDHCSAENFDQTFRTYLKPKEVSARLFLRDDEVKEHDFSLHLNKK